MKSINYLFTNIQKANDGLWILNFTKQVYLYVNKLPYPDFLNTIDNVDDFINNAKVDLEKQRITYNGVNYGYRLEIK